MNKANLRKNLMPLLIVLGITLSFAACKLTTNGSGFITPPGGGSGEYLFATSNNQVWSFSVNSTTGALGSETSLTGPSFSPGMVSDTAGKFLYLTDADHDTVEAFSISSTGVLTLSGSPYTVGTVPQNNATQSASGVAIDPTGKFLYVTDAFNNGVAAFTVTSGTGALTAVGNSQFATSATPTGVVVDASGKFVYVSNFNDISGGVSAFTLNTTSGVLTPVGGSSPFDTLSQGGPAGIASTGTFVYTAENIKSGVAALSINTTTGGLSTIPGSAFSTGASPVGVAVTPSGKYLYIANSSQAPANTPGTISAYSVTSGTGVLAAVPNSPFPTTFEPWNLAVDPSGSFLYATNPADGTITGYTINTSTGALTEFSGAPMSVGNTPIALTVMTVP